MAGASNESGVVDDVNFWRFEWLATSSKTSEIRPVVLYDDMLSRDYWTVDNANLSRFTRGSYLLD